MTCCCDPPNVGLSYRKPVCSTADGCNPTFSISVSGLTDGDFDGASVDIDCGIANGTWVLDRWSCTIWHTQVSGPWYWRLGRAAPSGGFSYWQLVLVQYGTSWGIERFGGVWENAFGPAACPYTGTFNVTRLGDASPTGAVCWTRPMFIAVTGA